MNEREELEVSTLGGGCFWCIEAVFEQVNGVEKVQSGYAGGKTPDPSYEEVCSGATGHAEVVQITFHRDIISFEEILNIFFEMHDPTTLNRQGADVGTQYRSVIFYHNDEQKKTAEKVIAEEENRRHKKIVTQVLPYEGFYKAEDYHQTYYRQNPERPYCQIVIAPKMMKMHSQFREHLKVNKLAS